jgi:hypothetical protein
MENQNTVTPQLTTKEVATILNCGVLNVIKHYRNGNLKATTLPNGKYLRYNPADVEYFKNTFKTFRTTKKRKELQDA